MTTSHMTPRILVAVLLGAITVSVPLIAQRVAEPELLLREALHKQQVQGDLPGAIKIYQQIYQQIVSAKSSNRAVTARALLELAGCYEKLGQQAETVYQQIVRDFSDQPAATQARARLAALRPPAPAPAMTLRKVEVDEGVLDVVRTDGQRAVFLEGPRNAIVISFGNLSGKERRTVGPAPIYGSVSPDLSAMVAYRLRTQRFSIIKTDGSGERVLDLRENGEPFTVSAPGPLSMDWSWDTRHVLITTPHETGSRLLRITVADGTVSEVQPGLSGALKAQFSPDGQFIAYRELDAIHVIRSSGGESHPITTKRGIGLVGLVDWTRDGRHVLISERTADGSLISAVPVQQGRRQGEPIVVRSVPGSRIQTMSNGSLFVSTGIPPETIRNTWLGVLDDRTASTTWTSVDLAESPIAGTQTPWLPDGTRFAYLTGDAGQTMRVIRVKNVATGDDRELYRADRIGGCVAAHEQDVLFCTRVTGEEVQIFSVSLESGGAEVKGTLSGRGVIQQMTTDDRKIVFYNGRTNSWFEWEIATGEQRAFPFYRSEDGRWSLRPMMNPMQIRPATGGADWRSLAPRSFASTVVRFTADGNWLLYLDVGLANKGVLYRVASDGREATIGCWRTSFPQRRRPQLVLRRRRTANRRGSAGR